jgi:hypothetical protein
LKTLWTFDTQAKLEEFAAILQKHEIAYEIASKSNPQKTNNDVTVSVEDKEFEKAKKLLLKHRKRRTSRDSSNITPPPGRMHDGH